MNTPLHTVVGHTTRVLFEVERELAPIPLWWAKALDEGDADILTDLLTEDVVAGNTWTFLVRRTPEGPRVARFTMDCRWIDGDPSVRVAAIP